MEIGIRKSTKTPQFTRKLHGPEAVIGMTDTDRQLRGGQFRMRRCDEHPMALSHPRKQVASWGECLAFRPMTRKLRSCIGMNLPRGRTDARLGSAE